MRGLFPETDTDAVTDASVVESRPSQNFYFTYVPVSTPQMNYSLTVIAVTKQCNKSGFQVTPPATTTIFVTTGATPSTSVPTSTPKECEGTKYSLKSTDTCQSVSAAQGISTADLLIANGLRPYCDNFPKSGQLCIPTSAKCKTYIIKSGDDCVKIADANKLTFTQFVTWNPVVGQTCRYDAININLVDYCGQTLI